MSAAEALQVLPISPGDGANDLDPDAGLRGKRLIYVLSTPRAGSTLLKSMLDAHPEIFAPAELHLWPYDNLDDAAQHLKYTGLDAGLGEALTRLLGDEAAAADQHERFRAEGAGPAEIVRWVLRRAPQRFLVDKSPTYGMNPEVLRRLEAFRPTAGAAPFFLHIERHPLDVLDSMLELDFHKLGRLFNLNGRRLRRANPDCTSPLVRSFVPSSDNPCKTPLEIDEASVLNIRQNIVAFLETIPEDRKLTLRYEDLVADPEAVTGQICDLLGLAHDPDMARPYASPHGGAGRAREQVVDPKHHAYSQITSKPVARWTARRAFWETHLLTAPSLEMARRLGYEMPGTVGVAPLTPAQRAAVRDRDTLPPFSLEMELTLRGGGELDLARLQAAARAVARDHDALRTSFHRGDRGWLAHVRQDADDRSIRVTHRDVRHMVRVAQGPALERELDRCRRRVERGDGPLFEVLVHRRADDRQVVAYVAHHMILDGAGLLRVHDDLWAEYEGQARPVSGAESGVAYARAVEAIAASRDTQADLERWTAELGEPERWSAEILARRPGGVGPERELRRRIAVASPVGPTRLSFHRMALAAYRTLALLDGTSRPLLVHRLARRRHAAALGFSPVTWLAGDAPIRLDLGGDPEDLRRALSQRMGQLPLDGTTHDWLVEQGKLPPLHETCPVRLNYQVVPRHATPAHADPAAMNVRAVRGAGMGPEFPLDLIVRDSRTECRVIARYAEGMLRAEEVESFLDHLVREFDVLGPGHEGVA